MQAQALGQGQKIYHWANIVVVPLILVVLATASSTGTTGQTMFYIGLGWLVLSGLINNITRGALIWFGSAVIKVGLGLGLFGLGATIVVLFVLLLLIGVVGVYLLMGILWVTSVVALIQDNSAQSPDSDPVRRESTTPLFASAEPVVRLEGASFAENRVARDELEQEWQQKVRPVVSAALRELNDLYFRGDGKVVDSRVITRLLNNTVGVTGSVVSDCGIALVLYRPKLLVPDTFFGEPGVSSFVYAEIPTPVFVAGVSLKDRRHGLPLSLYYLFGSQRGTSWKYLGDDAGMDDSAWLARELEDAVRNVAKGISW